MFRQFRDIERGEQFVVAADTGNGGGDRCAVQFLSLTCKDVPLVYHSPGITPDMTDDLSSALETLATQTAIKPLVTYELNNGGFNELVRLSKLNRSQQWMMWYQADEHGVPTDRMGWTTTEQSRRSMLVDLKDAIDNQHFRIYDPETVKELFSFVNMKRPGGGWKPQAEVNAHDDLVMSLAVTWQLALTAPQAVPANGFDVARIFTGGDRVTGYGSSYRKANVRTFR
jgi:hypothetical protein